MSSEKKLRERARRLGLKLSVKTDRFGEIGCNLYEWYSNGGFWGPIQEQWDQTIPYGLSLEDVDQILTELK